MRAVLAFVAAVLAAVSLSGCGDSDASTTTSTAAPVLQSIADTLAAVYDVSTFADELTSADLTTLLSGEGPFTVFAPTNEAFYALREEHLGLLSKDPDVMRYHVHSGSVKSAGLTAGQELSTLFADPISHNLTVSMDGPGLSIISETSRMAKVTAADIVCTNGVIHIIDAVLIPALPSTRTSTTTPHPRAIVETIMAVNDGFALGLLSAGGLWTYDADGVLDGDGPFTVFVPTVAAYQAWEMPTDLQPADLESFISSVSSYHVHSGLARSTDLTNFQVLSTLFSNVTTSHNYRVFLDKDIVSSGFGIGTETAQIVTVTTADIECTNGVIHLIDAVLIPNNLPSPVQLSV